MRARLVAPSHASEVVGPPEGSLEDAARRATAVDRPLSFLHATPDPSDDPRAAPEALRRAAAEYLEDRIDEGAFGAVEDGIFVYRISDGGHEQTALVADIHVDDYPGFVRPHERTMPEREASLVASLADVGMTSNPVSVTHRGSERLRAAVSGVTGGEPALDVLLQGERHVVWRVPPAFITEVSDAFDEVSVAYVLDGHHRMASARRYAHEVGASREDPAGRVLVAAVPSDELIVRPFHRWVDVAWPADGGPWEVGPPPSPVAGETVVVTPNGWRRVGLGGSDDELDVAALERTILGPLLGIVDTRTDDRLETLPGTPGASTVCDRVEVLGGTGFLLHPPSLQAMFSISDLGGVMPPKSTFFAPKPRSGIFLVDRRHPPAAYNRLQSEE